LHADIKHVVTVLGEVPKTQLLSMAKDIAPKRDELLAEFDMTYPTIARIGVDEPFRVIYNWLVSLQDIECTIGELRSKLIRCGLAATARKYL
jgi:hypothetical protein